MSSQRPRSINAMPNKTAVKNMIEASSKTTMMATA